MNTISITGNLTADATIDKINDTNIIKFSIANKDEKKKKDDGSYEDIVSFFNVTMWSKSGKMVNHLKKGKTVSISGKLKQDRWTDKEGQNRSVIKINAYQVIPHVYEKANETPQMTGQPQESEPTFEDDETPF